MHGSGKAPEEVHRCRIKVDKIEIEVSGENSLRLVCASHLPAAGVVNLGFLPDLVVWLGPTALITPVIFWWSARVTRDGVRT